MTTAMTVEQAEVLNDVWFEVVGLISAECHRRHLNTIVDEILSDAITRMCESIAKSGTTSADKIKSRARSCALDAIRTAYRIHRNVNEFMESAHSTVDSTRRNGAAMETPSPDDAIEPDEADPALCACVRVTDKKNRHSHFEFFSFGFEPIESAA